MKRMLVNATQPEELRVALVDGQRLYDLDIEHPSRAQKKANIYKGKITRIEPSLEACFVDYGAERHGFLPMKEIAQSYLTSKDSDAAPTRANIKNMLKEGMEVVVQVEKEERGNKGAALTTQISLAGRFLVLMPNNPRAGGVSRRVEGEDRGELRDALKELEMPKGMGVIIRTAGVGRSVEELQWDLDYLRNIWTAIERESGRKSPFLIYQESRLIVRALRDYYSNDVGEILVDSDDVYQEAKDFMEQVMPNNLPKLKLYKDDTPLFSRYQIESQIESAFEREVRLPSGGSIVIDQTEALISIDINSSRATKGADIEDTATRTNLEAAEEVGRQLRLRDTGGLVVIDFIDMHGAKNQRAVENTLREAVKADRARIQIGRISRFGLLEMSRQRIRPSLGESTHLACPRCSGQGSIRSVESLALSVMRLMEEEAMKENTGQVVAQLPVSVSTFLLNEKRKMIDEIQGRCTVQLLIIPNENLDTPHYQIARLRSNEMLDGNPRNATYRLPKVSMESIESISETAAAREAGEEPAVSIVTPTSPKPAAPAAPAPVAEAAPAAKAKPKSKNLRHKRPTKVSTTDNTGLVARLFAWISALFGGDSKAKEEEQKNQTENQRGGQNNRRGQNDRNAKGNRNNRNQNNRGKNQRSSEGDDKRGNQNSRNNPQGDDDKDENRSGNGNNRNRNRSRNRRPDGGATSTEGNDTQAADDASGTGERKPQRNRRPRNEKATDSEVSNAAAEADILNTAAEDVVVEPITGELPTLNLPAEPGVRRSRRGGRRRRRVHMQTETEGEKTSALDADIAAVDNDAETIEITLTDAVNTGASQGDDQAPVEIIIEPLDSSETEEAALPPLGVDANESVEVTLEVEPRDEPQQAPVTTKPVAQEVVIEVPTDESNSEAVFEVADEPES
ncbi:MAG: ribonuclease E, partial [Pseudoalteromonas tetraodonis]